MNGEAVLKKGEALRVSSRFIFHVREKIIESLLLFAALTSIAITLGYCRESWFTSSWDSFNRCPCWTF